MAVAIVSMFVFTASAQKTKPFQGIITYGITYSGANLTPAQKAQLPSSTTVYIKDCKSKQEVVTGMVTQGSIIDGNAKTQTVLLDLMGTKIVYRLTEKEISEDRAKVPEPKVTITTDTKVIAGITCKKATIISEDEEGTVSNDTVYFSEEIGCANINFAELYSGIPGLILEYTEFNPEADFTATFNAKEIKKTKVSDNIFLIPGDYKEVTKEELKSMFGDE